MELITNVLYWISTGLMIPVTILLLYFLIYSIIMIGGFYGNVQTHIFTLPVLC